MPDAVCRRAGGGSTVEAEPPEYLAVSGVSGTLSATGSDTVANLTTLWAEEFKRVYPNVNIQIQATGSSAAPTALTEITANIGLMSRAMRRDEIRSFTARYGYPPTRIPVALDALAILVHRDNPLPSITLAEIDAVISATLLCGARRPIDNWRQLGLPAPWADRGIVAFGRNSVSGSYGFFKSAALCLGDFHTGVNEQSGSGSLVQAIGSTWNGIGYSSIAFSTSSVRIVPVAWERDGVEHIATPDQAVSGEYPFDRYLLFYVNRPAGGVLPPLEREFIRMVLSRDGREIVSRSGYIPLPTNLANESLAALAAHRSAEWLPSKIDRNRLQDRKRPPRRIPGSFGSGRRGVRAPPPAAVSGIGWRAWWYRSGAWRPSARFC